MASRKFQQGIKQNQGISLIELSVLMTILAAAMVASLSWLSPSSDDMARRIATTRERMSNIQQALQAFRSQYGRLPCPANPTYDINHPNFGIEDCWERTAAPDFTDAMRGTVPVRTLGIQPSYIQDGWDRLFTYQVARIICDYDASAPIANQVGLPVNCTSGDYAQGSGAAGAGSGWLSVDTTNIAVNCADGVSCAANLSANVAYVLLSHGANGDRAFLPSGQQRVVAATVAAMPPREQRNIHTAAGDVGFWDDRFSAGFDDFILYETRGQLDAATTDFERRIFSQNDCLNIVSDTLGDIGMAEATAMNIAALTALFGATQTPDQAILGMLWDAQEVCIRYYATAYAADASIECPGSNLPNSRRFERGLWDTNDNDENTANGFQGFYANETNGGYTGGTNPNPITGDNASSPTAGSHLTRLNSADYLNRRIGFCRCPISLPATTGQWNSVTGTCS